MSELSKEELNERLAWFLAHCCIHTEPEEECRPCKLMKELFKKMKTPPVEQSGA